MVKIKLPTWAVGALGRTVKFAESGLFLKLTLLWFAVQGLFFALTTKVGLPPDESFHLQFIQLFSDNGFSPFIGFGSKFPVMGEVVHTPYFLYHWLFSFPFGPIESLEYSYIILRIFNLFMALGSLYVIYRLANLLKVPVLARNLSLFMLCNTLMFVFLSAAVSYDNLFILLSVSSVYLVFRLQKSVDATSLLLLVLCLSAGSLVKINFLGVASVVIAVFIWMHLKSLRELIAKFFETFGQSKRINILLVITLIFVGVLMVHRYGYNVVKYHSLGPDCTQVMSLEECRQNGLFARNESVFGERRRTPELNIVSYFVNWSRFILYRTYGILAHKEFNPDNGVLVLIFAYILVAILAIVRTWRKTDKDFTKIIFISVAYSLVVFIENFDIYKASGREGFVIHGRYLFAVLPLIYIIGSHYLFKYIRSVSVRGLIVGLTAVIFLYSGLPAYILHTNRDWYNSFYSVVDIVK